LCFVSETAQVELKTGRVSAPASSAACTSMVSLSSIQLESYGLVGRGNAW